MKPVAEVLHAFGKVYGDQAERINRYTRFKNAYFGVGATTTTNSSMDTTGRPILRMHDLRAELRSRRGAPNILQPIVDNFIAYKGQLPTVKVQPTEETPEGEDRATLRTRAARDILHRSNMAVQWINGAFYCSAMGDAVVTLDPVLPDDSDDLNPVGVYWTVHSPEICWGTFQKGRHATELNELFLMWEISADEAEELYGYAPKEMVTEVLTYYGRNDKQILIEGERVMGVQHDLGFVPAQWVRNKQVGNEFAQSDICQAVDVHEEMQSLFIVMGDATVESVYAPVWIKDALNAPGDQLVIGPREIIPLGEKGDIGRLAPAPPPQAATGLLGTLQQALFQNTGTAPVQIENQHSGSNLSGRYMHAEQQPMEVRLELNQTIVGYQFERALAKSFLMYSKIPELAKSNLVISGSDKGKPFTMQTTGAEIGGPASISVKWDAFIGSGRQQRLVMALQAFQVGLAPGTYVVEQLGEDDPEAFVRRAVVEKAELMKHQQALMPPPPGGPPGQGPPGGPPGGDPGAQQAQIMQPGADAAAAGAGSPAPPGGAPPSAGAPVQPPPPQQNLPPGFPPMDTSPMQQGMGPPPQTPDPMQLEREAIASLPPEVQADIVGEPVMVGHQLTVYVKSGKHVASGKIRHAFQAAGLDVKVKVAA